jgi:hypothetical protein
MRATPHLPHERDVVWIVLQLFPLEDLLRRRPLRPGQLEGAFHPRQLRIRPDGSGIGPAAEQHIQRVQDDGLACAGLAGENDQPRPEFQVELVDNGKIVYVQFSEHGFSPGQLDPGEACVHDGDGDE